MSKKLTVEDCDFRFSHILAWKNINNYRIRLEAVVIITPVTTTVNFEVTTPDECLGTFPTLAKAVDYYNLQN